MAEAFQNNCGSLRRRPRHRRRHSPANRARGSAVALQRQQLRIRQQSVRQIEATGQKVHSTQKVDRLIPRYCRFARAAAQNAGKAIPFVKSRRWIVARKKIEETDDDFWDQVLPAKRALRIRRKPRAACSLMSDGGAIVKVSSQAGRDGGGQEARLRRIEGG